MGSTYLHLRHSSPHVLLPSQTCPIRSVPFRSEGFLESKLGDIWVVLFPARSHCKVQGWRSTGHTFLTRATKPGMLSRAYAVGLTYTFDLLYISLHLLSSELASEVPEVTSASWDAECLISTIESTCSSSEFGQLISGIYKDYTQIL